MNKYQNFVLLLTAFISTVYFSVNEGLSEQNEAEPIIENDIIKPGSIVENDLNKSVINIGLTCKNNFIFTMTFRFFLKANFRES